LFRKSLEKVCGTLLWSENEMSRITKVTRKELAAAKSSIDAVSSETAAFSKIMQEINITEMEMDGSAKLARGLKELRGWLTNIDLALTKHNRKGASQ